ncbi:hypothetical protein [Nostoc sp.]
MDSDCSDPIWLQGHEAGEIENRAWGMGHGAWGMGYSHYPLVLSSPHSPI